MQANITKGYEQIEKHCPHGIICIGLDLLVAKDARLRGWIDFRRSSRSALDIQFYGLVNEVKAIIKERSNDYIGRHKLDGLMVTTSIVGLDGDPPKPLRYESIMADCLSGGSLAVELKIIREKIKAIKDGGSAQCPPGTSS